MLQKRPANERGGGDHGWLNTRHTFSFNDYYDPDYMGFRVLRVINEDRVQPGQGFGTHGHRDMEIISYVLEGALAHKDSLGTGSVLRPGEFQHMTAGTGIRHSEFNPSETELVHFYQIWIVPERQGLRPSYQQRAFPEDERRGRLRVVASPDGRDGSLTIRQDAQVFLASLGENQEVTHELERGRYAWLQVLRGALQLNGLDLAAGDGVAVSEEPALVIRATKSSEVMLFDMP
ncbi:MAG: pirin family protein [Planctomycetaceae bacterium]|nr:pirin family protein [Planctomycetaceae bacterium]